ncbi:MAG TPA: holdfast anchoring protein HfaA [Caulobacteraceae bacterium]|jgi:holdfast attachment protein HfaA|nr:holdfast anchoring protein HfaA [Caulobacteraceae bacterium]
MREANPVTSARAAFAAGSARLVGAGATGLFLAVAAVAHAQTIGNNGGGFNSGYSGSSAGLNNPIDVSTRDSNQNSVFINGVMQAPAGSVFSRASGFSQTASSGVGSSGLATAIGNNLSVVVQGSYNRVTVDSTQINNGDISANASLNGRVNLDGP